MIEKNKKKKKFSTSKLILWATFLMCIQIVLFCEYAIIRLEDASSIYAMIGAPIAFIPVVLGYYSKSKAENTASGITYEMAMLESGSEYIAENDIDEELVNEE